MGQTRHIGGESLDRQSPRKKRPASGRIMNSIMISGMGLGVIVLGGFAVFLANINPSGGATTMKADGIAVLTGGHARLEEGSRLLQQGLGDRMLVSGVNPDTSHEALVAALGIDPALYACCVDVDRLALDTIGNAREVALWADRLDYDSVIVVTNDYHMPRSLSELQRAAPDVDFQAHAVSNPPAADETFGHKLDRYRVLAGEYAKLLLSQARRLLPEGQ